MSDLDQNNEDRIQEANSASVVDTSHSRVVENRSLENVMEDNFFTYSMSVILQRALPDVRDGLKPVHRRILYSMEDNNWRSAGKFVKSARVVGDVIGKYHPHGDTSIYDAMVRLAQDWSMRHALVNGQGNFGSMDGDPPAAYRYTEAKMSRISEEMVADINKNTVDFRDNFDGSEQEPVVLPAKVPNLLLNGQIGIAVGMATNIPPHNLGEIVDATVELIDNDEATIDDLLRHIKGPDFPTGATVYGGAPMRQAYQTGRGSVTIRAVAEIEETKKGRHQIVVTEMPYAVNKSTLIERIGDLARPGKDQKITTISDIRDESARGKVRLVIELKKDAYPKKVLNQLYKMTSLQTSFHFNMLALIDGLQPRILGLREILHEFVKHRQIVVRRRTEFELEKAKARAHVLEGLKIALDHIDEVIKLIRGSKDYETALVGLMKTFDLSEIQAKAILAMQLRKLTGLDRQEIEDELKELLSLIAQLEKILANEKEILAIIKDELLELKDKYGDDRRSKMINNELGKFSDEELIPDEDVVVLITTENYIKRTLTSDYRRQHRGGKGKRGMVTKELDVIDQLVTCSTHDWLLFFTNKGRAFRLKAYEVPVAGLQAKGVAAVNLLQLQPEEKITTVIRVDRDNPEDGYLFMSTVNGTVKKTQVSDYANIRQTGLIAIRLDDGDELRWVRKSSGSDEIIVSTMFGQAIRFKESDARPMGRAARGVRGIRLRPGDKVVGMDLACTDSRLLVMSENGYGKMTKVDNFATHKRGGVGIKAGVVNKKTGNIITVTAIDDKASEVIMISTKGQTIRVALADIPTLGRTTQGVRVMRLGDNDTVASIGLIPEQQKELLESVEAIGADNE